MSVCCHYLSFIILFCIFLPTVVWCTAVYCNILSFIANALVLLTKFCSRYYPLTQRLPRNARMQTNQMKATLAICRVWAIYSYSSHLIGWHRRISTVN